MLVGQDYQEMMRYREAEEIYGVPITERYEELENQFKTETRKAGQVIYHQVVLSQDNFLQKMI